MDRLVTLASFGVTTAFLFAVAWYFMERGKIYSILLGGLGIYGFFSFEQTAALSELFSADVVGTAALIYAVGSMVLVALIVVFETVFPYRQPNSNYLWLMRMQRSGTDHVYLATVASVVALGLLLHTRSNLSVAWDVARQTNGVETSIAAFLLLLGTSGIASSLLRGKKFWALGLIIINVISFVLLGSRATMLAALGFWAWVVFLRQRSDLKRLRLLVILMFLGFAAQVMLRFVRGFGLDQLIAAISSGNIFSLFASSPTAKYLSGGEAAIAKYFMFSVELAPSGAFGFMTSVHRILLFFVPSSLDLLGKPTDVTYQLWAAAYSHGLFAHAEGAALLKKAFMSGDFGSIHPTLFGEMFASGEWFSLIPSLVFVAALCVIIDRCLNRLSDNYALLLLGPTTIGLLFVARGNSVIGFGYFIYLTIFVLIVEFMFGRLGVKAPWRVLSVRRMRATKLPTDVPANILQVPHQGSTAQGERNRVPQ